MSPFLLVGLLNLISTSVECREAGQVPDRLSDAANESQGGPRLAKDAIVLHQRANIFRLSDAPSRSIYEERTLSTQGRRIQSCAAPPERG